MPKNEIRATNEVYALTIRLPQLYTDTFVIVHEGVQTTVLVT